jgi:hypothetical protein
VTLHNIRNIAYRTDTDCTPRYYDKTFDLQRLESADLISSHWAGQAIAHIFGSFDFGGRGYVAISAEIRKAHGQDYSTLAGFFKQYTLIYVVADERDVIARAQAAGDALDFSQRIRAGLPMPLPASR